jgi:hypothetical protein
MKNINFFLIPFQRKFANLLSFIRKIGFISLFFYTLLFLISFFVRNIGFLFDRLVKAKKKRKKASLLVWNENVDNNYIASSELKALKEIGDSIVDNSRVVIGTQVYDLSSRAVWFYDPVSKNYISKSINLSNYSVEVKKFSFDLRIVWEINRLQFLVTLAQVAVITGNRIYIDCALKIINRWVDENSYEPGPNWIDAQESGIRLVNVLLFKEIIERSGGSVTLPRLFVFYHLKFILSKISINRVTHNHFFTESCSLYASLLLLKPHFLSLASFFISKIIATEVNKQLDNNGFSYEGSSNYTLFICDALALVSALEVDQNICHLSNNISYERFALCCTALDLGNGDIVKIGDADCGRYIKVNWVNDLSRDLEIEFFYSLSNNSNVAVQYLSFLFMRGALPQKIYKKSNSFYQNNRAGLFIITKQEKKIVVYAGARCISDHVRIGHSHSDLMSFTYFVNGQNIFIDPGTFLYVNGLVQRRLLRTAKRHNCVLIDGQEYAQLGEGFFGITALALVSHFDVVVNEGYTSVFCEVKIEGGIVQRCFRFSSDLSSLRINTSVKKKGEHFVTEYLNIGCQINNFSTGRNETFLLLNSGDKVILSFHSCNDSKSPMLMSKVSSKVIAWAPRYGVLKNGYQLRHEMRFKDHFSFSTKITFEKKHGK